MDSFSTTLDQYRNEIVDSDEEKDTERYNSSSSPSSMLMRGNGMDQYEYVTNDNNLQPWHPTLRQSTSSRSLLNMKQQHQSQLLPNIVMRSSSNQSLFTHKSKSNSNYSNVTNQKHYSNRLCNVNLYNNFNHVPTAIGGTYKKLRKNSLAPSGRSALFTHSKNGLKEYLKNPNKSNDDIHSLNLNHLVKYSKKNYQLLRQIDSLPKDDNEQQQEENKETLHNSYIHANNRVIDADDETCLLTVTSKCKRLRCLSVENLKNSVNDSFIHQLP
jgi:hypothetical protein